MPFLEALKLAVSAILGHKLRSFLTLLGVIFGVATVIVVVSLIEGFNAYVDEKIANIGTNAFSVSKYAIEDFSSVEALNAARRRNKDVTMEDAAALAARGGSIHEVGGKEDAAGDVKFGSINLFRVHISATTPNIAEIERIEVGEGRYFTKSEEESRRNVTFIGADVADKLFPAANPLAQTIRVDGRPFEIIGVGKAKGSVFGQPQDMYVAMPLATFLAIYGSRRSINLSVTSTSQASYDDAVEEARVVMRTRRKLSPNEKDNFGIITPSAINELRDKIFGTIQVAAIGITSISLVVGGIVIMNIMLVSVTERTKEIGIRKSIGARRSDILKQFLAESTMLSLLGGAIGIAIA
jgi:putative ABC transport system permease protein